VHIAIDATSIPSRPVGVGNYLIKLVHCFNYMSLENEEIIVFVHRRCVALFGSLSNPKVKIIAVQDKSPGWRLIWQQTELPLLLWRYSINLLHSPHYAMPLLARCHQVVTFHDLTFILFPQLHVLAKRVYFRAMMRISCRLADAIITISENTRQDLLKVLKTPPSKVISIPLGVGPEFHPLDDFSLLEQVRRSYNLPARFFLYVGTIEPRKNLPLLFNAYQKYCMEGGDAGLIIVGQQGWMVEGLIQTLQGRVAEDRVRWLGYVPQQDLTALYNLALALVYPTLYEGFGLPPLEAMACGTPVISSAVGAIVEHVGDAGILLSPNDETGLTRAMLDIAKTPELCQAFRNKGLERTSWYTWERTAIQTLKVYRHILYGD
jgi:glycosyltransferase involved in cell wall biosynthesis